MRALTVTKFGFIELNLNKYLNDDINSNIFKFNVEFEFDKDIFINILNLVRHGSKLNIEFSDYNLEIYNTHSDDELVITYLNYDKLPIYKIKTWFDFEQFKEDIYNDYKDQLKYISNIVDEKYINKINKILYE